VYSSDIFEPNAPRRRRRYDPQFKADLVAHCQQRGISVASVAQDHGINANLLRRWIQEHERYGEPETNVLSMPAKRDIAAQFIAIPAPCVDPETAQRPEASPQIEITLERAGLKASIQWPLSHAEQCAAWLRDVMR